MKNSTNSLIKSIVVGAFVAFASTSSFANEEYDQISIYETDEAEFFLTSNNDNEADFHITGSDYAAEYEKLAINEEADFFISGSESAIEQERLTQINREKSHGILAKQ